MIDLLLAKLAKFNSRAEKVNYLREYLQILVLKQLADAQSYQSIAFLGGTALRILYQLRRYSEDLDFSVSAPTQYSFEAGTNAIESGMSNLNIAAELRVKRGVVDSCMINFTSVLRQCGIAVARDQKLSIKLEIDTNPPAGAVLTESIINTDYIFPLRHYDLPSLMAGKLHAVLYRKYTKGRDYYDLLWYLTRKIEPNLELLANAIEQSQGMRPDFQKESWQTLLLSKLQKANFSQIRRDLAPFLEDINELGLIDLRVFEGLVK